MTMHEDFLGNHSHSPAAQAFHRTSISGQPAEVKAKLIHNVRRNSKRYGVLTSSHILTVIAQDLPANFHCPLLESISHDPLCSDIRTLVTKSGQLFFYSIAHMSIEDAATKGQLEEVKLAMAERIRRDSRIATALTPLNAMFALFPEITQVKVCAMLNEMQTQAHYRDIKTVSSTSGELYLYCDAHVTEKYASMLARSAVSDACQTIVDTVREESRLYPKPTKVSAFTSQVYGIPPTTLQPCIVRVLNATEYADIRKLVHPETESEYLYSNLHMTEEQAVALMKWLEEGRQPST
ncbi:hypothetical protein E4633_09535 [Geomonas terrae]|uniref:Uncharacterized protein n=1 Tax=Geomonas terrae TaxID=2562681 RepID=A0A4S1CG46_9BACT|nr:hypothetical protein [Geomonas terrae]TGU72535.1 hypothetical protein E4633_09535 [Geomonas terrae]